MFEIYLLFSVGQSPILRCKCYRKTGIREIMWSKVETNF